MREEGYYFVKLEGKWEIAKFYIFLASVATNNHGFWNSIGWDRFRTDLDFDEIGDKIELPKDQIMEIKNIDLKEILKKETYTKESKELESVSFTLNLQSKEEIYSFKKLLNYIRESRLFSGAERDCFECPFVNYDSILKDISDTSGRGSVALYLILESLLGGHAWESYIKDKQ